jgi:hypothetical protein
VGAGKGQGDAVELGGLKGWSCSDILLLQGGACIVAGIYSGTRYRALYARWPAPSEAVVFSEFRSVVGCSNMTDTGAVS